MFTFPRADNLQKFLVFSALYNRIDAGKLWPQDLLKRQRRIEIIQSAANTTRDIAIASIGIAGKFSSGLDRKSVV